LGKNAISLRVFSVLFFFLLSVGIFISSAVDGEAKETLRALILRDVSQFTIAGEEMVLKDLTTGHLFFHNRKSTSITIERSPGPRLTVRGLGISAPAFVLASPLGPLTINGRRYRHQIRIYPANASDLWVVNELPQEEYLVGLINWEISSQWPMEAVKAQVVAARTYAVFQRQGRQGELFDVEATVADQVYGGMEREDARSLKAVRDTGREVILYRGAPAFSVYHSCCGGKTESPEYLWTGSFPYLKSIECPYCLDSPHFVWNYQVDRARLRSALNQIPSLGSRILDVRTGPRNESQRILQITVQGENDQVKIAGPDFRKFLGRDLIRSTNFVVKETNGVFSFAGLGWGHGAGLCQWGTKGMAEAGENYHSILRYYYKDTTVGKFAR
jgi:stage II sporulation protein D